MKRTIREKYNDLAEDLYIHYNKVLVIDNYDYDRSNPYTIFYLNNNDNFNDFKELWDKNKNECQEEKQYDCYDNVIDSFYEKARDKFDCVELSTVNIYTKEDYELEI